MQEEDEDMSAATATATDLPGEGLFQRASRRARAFASSVGRGTVKAAAWLGRMLKRGAKATGRGSLRVVGGAGWLVTGALKLVLGALSIVGAVVFAVVSVVIMIVGALLLGLGWVIGMLLVGLGRLVNYLWDGANWLVRGRKVSWKMYRGLNQGVRETRKTGRMDGWLERVGIVDNDETIVPVVTDVPEVDANEAAILRVYDDEKNLVQEKTFLSESAAYDFADERYTNMPVVIEVKTVADHADEVGSASWHKLTQEQRKIEADKLARQMLGEEVAEVRRIIDEDVAVPSQTEVAASVYAQTVLVDDGEKLSKELIAQMDDPRNADWSAYLFDDLIPEAYQYFANKARVAGDKREASYWAARLWMRTLGQRNDQRLSWQKPNEMFALYRSSVDKANTVLNQARQGIHDECKTLIEAHKIMDALLEEQDRIEDPASAR